jgi:N-acetylglucosaminyldiphosphoundecaprenol N-acetyl-beta-D-mannosaminyltransferase
MNLPTREPVLGSAISAIDEATALEVVEQRLLHGGGGYVCFTNVHAVVTGRQDDAFQAVTNRSFLSLADGKPVFWLGRMQGNGRIGHVPGPDFMLAALHRFRDRGHFFYGSTPAVLERLTARLSAAIPGLRICGTLSPPFRALTDADLEAHRARIVESGAQFVWVGLGAPKQEFWMAHNAPALQNAILFGVGAAFDFHAGVTRRAPEAMRKLGLEWLFRLASEPRRLWKRYLVTNTLFLAYAARDAMSRRSGPRASA